MNSLDLSWLITSWCFWTGTLPLVETNDDLTANKTPKWVIMSVFMSCLDMNKMKKWEKVDELKHFYEPVKHYDWGLNTAKMNLTTL